MDNVENCEATSTYFAAVTLRYGAGSAGIGVGTTAAVMKQQRAGRARWFGLRRTAHSIATLVGVYALTYEPTDRGQRLVLLIAEDAVPRAQLRRHSVIP